MFKTTLNPNRNLCWKRRASSLALRFEDQKWAPIKSSRVLSMPVTLPKTNLKPRIGGFEDHFPFKGVIFGFHVRFRGSTVYTVNHNQRPASGSDVYLTFSMAFLREGAMYIWSIANWQTSQFWTVAAQTNAQRSFEATEWSSISLKATDQADPLHNCHSPLLRSGRVRLWFQFWGQSFQSRCQEANQHSVYVFCAKKHQKSEEIIWNILKNTHDSDSKNLGESLPRHFERSLTEADFNLCQLRICFGSFLGEFGSLQVQHLCNMVLVNLLHECYDLHGWELRFNRFSLQQKSLRLRSWINLFCFGALLLSEYSWNPHGLGQVECTQTSPSNKKMHLFAR